MYVVKCILYDYIRYIVKYISYGIIKTYEIKKRWYLWKNLIIKLEKK